MSTPSISAVTEWIARYGLVAVFFGPMIEIVLPIVPGDVGLVFAGFAAQQGYLPLLPVLALGGAGAIAGITVSYAIGRFLGVPFVEKFGRYIHVNRRSLERVNAWHQRYGKFSLTFGFFVPGARHVIAVAAGISKLGYAPFALHAYTGALLWSATLVMLGYFFGQPVVVFVARNHRVLLLVAGAMSGLVVLAWIIRRRMIRSARGGAAAQR